MSGKSQEEIAFELVAKLKGMGVWGEKNMPDILDMYAECLDACKGKRPYIPGRAVMDPAQRAKLDAQAAQARAQQQQQARAPQAPAPQQHAPQPQVQAQAQAQPQQQAQQRIMPTQVQQAG